MHHFPTNRPQRGCRKCDFHNFFTAFASFPVPKLGPEMGFPICLHNVCKGYWNRYFLPNTQTHMGGGARPIWASVPKLPAQPPHNPPHNVLTHDLVEAHPFPNFSAARTGKENMILQVPLTLACVCICQPLLVYTNIYCHMHSFGGAQNIVLGSQDIVLGTQGVALGPQGIALGCTGHCFGFTVHCFGCTGHSFRVHRE